MNKGTILLLASSAGFAAILIASVPLYYSPVLALSGPPLYPVQLRIEKSTQSSRLVADTQGKAVTSVHLNISSPLTGNPAPGCIINGHVLSCSFTQSEQQQLVPLFLFSTQTVRVQVLPGSSITSQGMERLRQLPTLQSLP